MQNDPNLRPYTGRKKYIFISYAHLDSARVLPVVYKLIAAGYRVWYDDAIETGHEWDDDIALHVLGCEVFLPFVSENYLASDNCRKEMKYAVSKKRQTLGVVLEDVSFKGARGIEMYITSTQYIRAQQMDTDEIFEKIAETKFLRRCYAPQKAAVPGERAEERSEPIPPPEDVSSCAEHAETRSEPASPPDVSGISVWLLALVYTALLFVYAFRNFPEAHDLQSTIPLLLLHLVIGIPGAAAIAAEEKLYPSYLPPCEKPDFGLLLRSVVTGWNLIFPLLLAVHGDSLAWQIAASGVTVGACWFIGVIVAPLRQLGGKKELRYAFSLLWAAALSGAQMCYRGTKIFCYASIMHALGLGCYAVLLLIAALRRKETAGWRFAAHCIVCCAVIALALCVIWQSVAKL